MTLDQIYGILESRIFYEQAEMKKFTFTGDSIHIDRRASIPFTIYKENQDYYLAPDTAITSEKDLRIQIETAELIHFYGKQSGNELLTLVEYL